MKVARDINIDLQIDQNSWMIWGAVWLLYTFTITSLCIRFIQDIAASFHYFSGTLCLNQDREIALEDQQEIEVYGIIPCRCVPSRLFLQELVQVWLQT